jgi:hypothetical protein
MYDFLKSKPLVLSIEVYAIDDRKSEIEYTFRGSAGSPVTSNLWVYTYGHRGKFPYNGGVPNGTPDEATGQAMDFLGNIAKEMESKCTVEASFVNVVTIPERPDPPRQRVDMSTQQ